MSPHFPPGEAVGALRWQKLARVAHERGWGLDVVTMAPDSLERCDEARLAQLPESTRMLGVPSQKLLTDSLEAWALAARNRFRPRPGPTPNGAVPSPGAASPASLTNEEMRFDPRSPRAWLRAHHARAEFAREAKWVRHAVRRAAPVVDPSVHRAVISCGPPHVMAHETARQLAKRAGLPLVLDYRDPWSLVDRLPADIASPLWRRLAVRYETRCIEEAGIVVMNTEPAARAMAERFPAHANKFIAVTNGYDDDPLPPSNLDGTFRIAYAGTLYLDRSPELLMRACARVIREENLTPDDLALELMGHVQRLGGRSVSEMAKEAGVDGFVHLHPRGTRAEAAEFLARGCMLVSLPQDAHLCIPSKIFEYMRYDAWLLVMAIRDSATAELLRGTTADVVSPEDEEELTRILSSRCREFRNGARPVPLAEDQKYSRRAQGEHFFDALNSLLESGDGRVR